MTNKTDRFSREQLYGEHLNGQSFTVSGKKYILGGKLGEGAIGVVRRATDLATNKTVAIKFLAPERRFLDEISLGDISRRFKREGERGVGLEHHNLVQVIAYEENEGGSSFEKGTELIPQNPFIVMEYIHGRTLEDFLKKDKEGIPRRSLYITKDTLYIAFEISKALVYLHRHGIVHRDVKPSNIFISKAPIGGIPKAVKLGDFGVVKWGDYRASISTGTLTVTGQSGLGTLKYMAPEQSLDPQNVDVKSDMYPFGITLFELFTNHILRDIHHVIQIRDVRNEKGNLFSRLHTLQIPFPSEFDQYEFLLETILDCFRKRSGRPTSTRLQGVIRRHLEKFGENLVWD